MREAGGVPKPPRPSQSSPSSPPLWGPPGSDLPSKPQRGCLPPRLSGLCSPSPRRAWLQGPKPEAWRSPRPSAQLGSALRGLSPCWLRWELEADRPPGPGLGPIWWGELMLPTPPASAWAPLAGWEVPGFLKGPPEEGPHSGQRRWSCSPRPPLGLGWCLSRAARVS